MAEQPAGFVPDGFVPDAQKPPVVPPSVQSPTWMQQHPKTRQAVRGVLDTLPVAGALAGGAIATPETLWAGTVPAAALGAGVGRGARDLLAEYLGVDEPTSPLSKAARISLDTAITAAVPAITSRVKDLLAAPKATLADVIEGLGHPMKGGQKALDAIAEYLRAGKTPSAPARFANDISSQVDRYMPNVSSAVANPATDVASVKALIAQGTPPAAAVKQVVGDNPQRFGSLMTLYMRSRQVQ